jgi:hypothetical protein
VLLSVGEWTNNGVSSAASDATAKVNKAPIRIAIRKRMLPPGEDAIFK